MHLKGGGVLLGESMAMHLLLKNFFLIEHSMTSSVIPFIRILAIILQSQALCFRTLVIGH